MAIRNFLRLFVFPVVIRKHPSHKRRFRNWLGYALYTLVLLIGFLYVLFPYKDAQLWSEKQVEQRMGIQMHAKQRTAGPFWFKWNELRLSLEHPSVIDVLAFPMLHVNFHVASILSQSLRFSSAFLLWDGRGEGSLTILPDDGDDEYQLISSFMNIQMAYAELPYMTAGRLSLDLDYQWHHNQPLAGQGQAYFSLESLQMDDLPLRADLRLSLAIPAASGIVNIEDAVMTVRDFHVRGEGFSFSGQGQVYMDPLILDSRVEAEGILYLSQEFSQQFPSVDYLALSPGQPIILNFSGTVRNPVMELNGIPIPLQPAMLFSSMSSFSSMHQ